MSLHPLFARPKNLSEACDLLAGLNAGAVVIAGGQELMPAINQAHMMPDVYIDINGIKDLKGVSEDEGTISIGALTVHSDVQSNDIICEKLPILAFSASQVGGGMQVHNRGTIGGNIVSMHPLYDITPSLMALDAKIEIVSAEGTKEQAVCDLIKDPNHGLGSDTILSRIIVEPMNVGSSWGYQKFKNSGGAYGAANAAAIIETDGAAITSIKLVVGGSCQAPMDVSDTVSDVIGKALDDEAIAVIEANVAAAITDPLDDHQGHGAWRKAITGVMAARAIKQAYTRAQEG